MKKKVEVVYGGRSKRSAAYKLLPNGVFLGRHHSSTAANWREVLDALFKRAEPTATLRVYSRAIDPHFFRANYGSVFGRTRVGCNTFNRVSIRKIARWAGWSPLDVRTYLSK